MHLKTLYKGELMIIKSLLILLCMILDRLRGDKKDIISRTFEKFAYGACVGFIAGVYEPLKLIAFAVAFAVGVSPGWGGPIGSALGGRKMIAPFESWQKGSLLQGNVLLALITRGVIWAFPVAIVSLYSGGFVASLPIVIGFVLAPYIAKNRPIKMPFCHKSWQEMEIYRAFIISTGTLIGAALCT